MDAIESMEEAFGADVSAPMDYVPDTWEDVVLSGIRARIPVLETVEVNSMEVQSITLTTRDGARIFITHGSEDGRLMAVPTETVKWVVCCHPHAVQQHYPHLPILGDWEGTTSTYLSNGVLRVCENTEEMPLW